MEEHSQTWRGILLDIEGTTSSISFVYDEMFPFVRRELDRFLSEHWSREDVQAAAEQIAKDAGASSLSTWTAQSDARQAVSNEVIRLMDDDVKATGLKQLQGLIWDSGFRSGELQAHLYPDVSPALEHWRQAGIDVRIYSSGSVKAQKLFFGHTIVGDLLSQFNGHYDTQVGSKREAESYRQIAAEFACPASEILFVSDVPAELDAASSVGMQTRLCCRPGNAEVDASVEHVRITSFAQLLQPTT